MSTVNQINANFEFSMFIELLEFRFDPETGRGALTLELVNHERSATKRVRVEAGSVTEWRVGRVGAGKPRLTGLLAVDVRSKQLDRVRFELLEVEGGEFWLQCGELKVETISSDP